MSSPLLKLVPKPETVGLAPTVQKRSEDGGPSAHRSKKPESNRHREYIKVRISPKDADAAAIVEGWTAQKKGTENLAQAIRLYDALLRGDLDRVREIAPLLSAALGSTTKRQKRSSSPFKDSDSFKSKDSEERGGTSSPELIAAICEVTASDPVVNQRKVNDLALTFEAANYTPIDVRLWKESVWANDWRGRRGDIPTLVELEALIGRVRTLPPVAVPATNVPPEATEDIPPDDLPEIRTDTPQQQPIRDKWWMAAMNDLELGIGRVTFRSHLAGLKLERVERDPAAAVYHVAAPHEYDREWVELHALESMQRILSDLNRIPARVMLAVKETNP